MVYIRGKKGIYWYRFRFGGRMVHESTKTTSKTLARDAERQRRRELEERWNRIEKRKLPPTLNDASKLWLSKKKALASGTRITYEAALKRLRAFFGNVLICDIDATDIAGYQKARLANGAAGATINKEVVCLSSILRLFRCWAQICDDVKNLAENEPGRALSREEEQMLLKCCSSVGAHQGSWSPLYTVTVLALNTGLRHKEIRTLRWNSLDLQKRMLIVLESKTEAGRRRPVPLTQAAWAVLDIWASRFPNRKPEDFIFPACENGHIQSGRPVMNWRTAWRRATRLIECPACGRLQNPGLDCTDENCRLNIRNVKSAIANLRFHDLRHTAATKLLETGSSFAIVAQILGWSASAAVRMAKRYGHIRPEVQRRALETIATTEIQLPVHQFVHQTENALQSERRN